MIDLRSGEIRHVPDWEVLMESALSGTTLDPQGLARLPFASQTHLLQEVLCEHLAATYRWPSHRRQIVLTYGATEALEAVFSAAVRRGGKIGMCVPSFPFWRIAQKVERGVRVLRIDPNEITRAIHDGCIDALLLVQPHNPSGRSWLEDELRGIERVALASGCSLILDIVGSSALASASRWSTAIDPARWWIVDSFSKQFAMPGLRLGYVRKPDGSQVEIERQGLGVGVSSIISALGFTLMSRRHAFRQVIEAELAARRTDARQLLAACGLNVPKDGIFLCIDTMAVTGSRCARALTSQLAAAGVDVAGEEFLLPARAAPALQNRFIRISLGSECREQLRKGLTILAEMLECLRCNELGSATLAP